MKQARKCLLSFIICTCIAGLASCSHKNDDVDHKRMTATSLALYISAPFIPGPLIDYTYLEPSQRGRLIASQRLYDLPLHIVHMFIQQFLASQNKSLNDFPSFTPLFGAECHYIAYKTHDWDGSLIRASGVLWVPRCPGPTPLLVYCHGTQIGPDLMTIRAQPGLFAPRGFIAGGPDYIGYGDSADHDHPYLHANTLASCTIDFIRAAKKFIEYNTLSFDGRLFITGVSEGGMTAMATVREIEANYTIIHPITAAAPISGPYDLSGTASYYIVPNKNFTAGQLNYLLFMVPIYITIYHLPRNLTDIFQEPYATWFSEDRYPRGDWQSIASSIPTNTSLLMKESFITSYQGGGEVAIVDALRENNTYEFVPQTYLRLYAATSDTHVPPSNADTAYDYFISHNAPHVSIEKVAGDHGSSGLPLLARMIDWFSTF